MARKSRKEREATLLGAFIANQYPGDRVMFNVRLGPIPIYSGMAPLPKGLENALTNFRRWADCVVIGQQGVTIIEAKVIMDPGLPSTLKLYGMLWRQTPEYRAYWHLPITLLAVVAFEDPVLTIIARREGIQVVVFTPPNLAVEMLEDYFAHKRKSTVNPLNPTVLDPEASK